MDLIAFSKTNAAARIRAAAGRGALSHALILSGTGDLFSAAHFSAAALECSAADKPCLACAHCRKVFSGIHPDVRVVRDAEHAEISVEVIRDVRTDAFVRPNEGACKVYLFPDCALLNEKDQNVLLKTVEEGPPYAAFLFCAENPSVLLPTIRSRCAEVKIPPPEAAEEAAPDERVREFLRLLADSRAPGRAAFLFRLETAKVTREELASLFARSRAVLVDALCAKCGAAPDVPHDADALRAVLTSRLTKAQILGTIELLETYRNHCQYNVGVGPLLGGLAVDLEEIL